MYKFQAGDIVMTQAGRIYCVKRAYPYGLIEIASIADVLGFGQRFIVVSFAEPEKLTLLAGSWQVVA